jgi:hypothetical protein
MISKAISEPEKFECLMVPAQYQRLTKVWELKPPTEFRRFAGAIPKLLLPITL